jgi:HEAT repeat protein
VALSDSEVQERLFHLLDDSLVSGEAAAALVRIAPQNAVRRRLMKLFDHPDRRVRIAAARALSFVGARAVQKRIFDLVCASRLGHLSFGLVSSWLDFPAQETWCSLRAFPDAGSSLVTQEDLLQLSRSWESDTRLVAAREMATAISTRRIRRRLLRLARDPSSGVRCVVAIVLRGAVGNRSARNRLVELACDDSSFGGIPQAAGRSLLARPEVIDRRLLRHTSRFARRKDFQEIWATFEAMVQAWERRHPCS